MSDWKPTERDMRIFQHAFSTGGSGCRQLCGCGRNFYDNSENHWDWEEGEFESLEQDPESTAVDGAVATIEFEGTQYVFDCDCWHERASRIIGFILGHDEAIAKFLNTRRDVAMVAAKMNPKVEGVEPMRGAFDK